MEDRETIEVTCSCDHYDYGGDFDVISSNLETIVQQNDYMINTQGQILTSITAVFGIMSAFVVCLIIYNFFKKFL